MMRDAIAWRRGVSLLAGIATVALLVAIGGTTTPPQNMTAGPRGIPPGPERSDGVPCSPGLPTSLDEVAREEDRPVYFPNHNLAGPDSVTAGWICGERLVIFQFDSGLLFQIGTHDFDDPAAYYALSAEENPKGEETPVEVRGHPGREIDPDVTGTRIAGGIEWTEGQWVYVLAGMGKVSLETLREILETVTLYTAR